MTPTDRTARSQTDSLSFEFDLPHPPEKVWRALTDPGLLAEWLLPVVDLKLETGAVFTFKTQPYPGWDGTVNCRMIEIEAHRKLSYAWSVPFLDTVVTFTLAPTASGTHLSLLQSGFKPDQKQEFGGARYGWKMMGEKLVELLGEDVMNWSQRVRQIHRWMSMVFTVAVVAAFVALGQKEPVVWVSYVPLLPLALLWFTGMYLFVLPYATKWRSGRRAGTS